MGIVNFIYKIPKGTPYYPVIKVLDGLELLPQETTKRDVFYDQYDRATIDWNDVELVLARAKIDMAAYLFKLPKNDRGISYILVNSYCISSEDIETIYG